MSAEREPLAWLIVRAATGEVVAGFMDHALAVVVMANVASLADCVLQERGACRECGHVTDLL